MSLPTTKKYPAPHISSGTYNLVTNAVISVYIRAVACTTSEFEQAWDIMPPAVPNPMNPRTNILRRQGTFGAQYGFGKQTSPNMGPCETSPTAILRCLQDAQRRAGELAHLYTAIHVNWYPKGNAALGAHQDTEPSSLAGHPIYSYTLIGDHGDDSKLDHRYFVVSKDRKQKEVVACVPTRDGDLIVMQGEQFQRQLWHSVAKTARPVARRINVTVRAWAGADKVNDR